VQKPSKDIALTARSDSAKNNSIKILGSVNTFYKKGSRKKSTVIFTRDKKFYKSLFLLALPIALQNLVTFSVGLADSVMVGSLGDAAVSGMYMGNQIQTLLQVFSGGIEGAILILAAQYWGKRDTGSIKKIVAIGIRLSVIVGALLTAACAIFPSTVISLFAKDGATVGAGAEYLSVVCFSYVFFCITQSLIAAMRSVEVARVGLYVSLCSLVTNIGLNYVLIFGKLGFEPMGIKGAAVATLIARIIEAAIISVYVFIFDKRLSLKIRDLAARDKLLLHDFFKYGAPIIAGQLVWATNMLASAAIMGRQSAKGAVAAMSIANTVNNLAYVVMNGMSGAVGIITGKTIGAGQESKMREYARTVQIIFLSLGLVTGGAVQLLKNPFISLYAVSAEAALEAAKYINVLSVTLVGTCYQAACLFGLVKSGGDISFVFKNDFIFVFFVVLPSAIICTLLDAPAWVVFACLKCDQILKCFVAVVKINRFNWMKNLTRKAADEKT
jgi:putative MATE family efflux protein